MDHWLEWKIAQTANASVFAGSIRHEGGSKLLQQSALPPELRPAPTGYRSVHCVWVEWGGVDMERGGFVLKWRFVLFIMVLCFSRDIISDRSPSG